jgi:electron transfer flavoprotein alpha subunit
MHMSSFKLARQISDVQKVISSDTFERPIYAGNAIATVKSNDPIKIFTVRTSAFEAATEGSSEASVEDGSASEGQCEWRHGYSRGELHSF